MTKSREWLLYNAVKGWLFYHQADSPMSEQYQQLHEELRDAYMLTLSKDAAPEPTQPAPKQPRKGRTNASQSSAKTV